jgi:uncharacterized membrane protein HdeD (DUF308 family)
MIKLFSKFWWTFVVRGLVAILFGLLVVSWPGFSLDGLVFSFGIFALLQGIFSFVPGVSKHGEKIYFLLFEGVIGLLAGVLTFLGPGIGGMFWPEVTTMTLLFFVAFWALLSGIAEVIGSFRLPGAIKGKSLITLSGFVCLLLGLFLLFRSGLGALGNASAIGLFIIVFGLLWSFIGFKARMAR